MNVTSTDNKNNYDIQAILNEVNEEEDSDDDFLLQQQDSMADLSSLSIGGVTNAFLFAPAQIAAAVTSARQQRLSSNKTASTNRRREIDIEQILRESDECDNVEDVVNALLHQHLPHHAQFLLQDDEDDGSTIESYSHHLNKFSIKDNVRIHNTANNTKSKQPQQQAEEEEEEEESESWGTGSATTTTSSDEEMDQFSKSTISTKLGAAEHHHHHLQQMNADFYTAAKLTKKSSSKHTSTDDMTNARDWAVLQSILAENDYAEDDDNNPRDFTTLIEKSSSQLATPKLGNSSNIGKLATYYSYDRSNHFDVDTILQDDDDDFEDDDQHLTKPTNNNTKPVTISSLPPSTTQQQPGLMTSTLKGKPITIPTTGTTIATRTTTTTASISDSITTAAMAQAQLCETRLLHGQQHSNNSNVTFSLVSPLSVKRRMKPKIEIWTKSRQKTSQHQQEHAAAGRYKFSGGALTVTCLSQISNYMTRASALALHNLPTALAVSSKFVCIGTQSGCIYIYDMFQEKRQTLESPDGASVTSIDINGETLLIAGYSTGTITLWDAFTGKPLKTCTDLHATNSPITLLRFLPSTTAGNTDDYNNNNSSNIKEDEGLHCYAAISVDASGLVNKLMFAKSLVGNLLLWGGIAGGYSVEVECLLDGSAGQMLALEVLPSLSQMEKEWRAVYEKNKHFMRRVVLISLSSIKSSFVVAVEPSICVLHRWSKQQPQATPTKNNNANNTQENDSSSSLLPCLSWGWSLVSGGGNVVHPILARAWGQTLQLLRANYITAVNAPTDDESNVAAVDHDSQQWPAFGVLSEDEFTADSTIVSLHWINERSLAYLTANCEFTVIDTVCMTLLERFDFSLYNLVYAELKLSGVSASNNNATFANSIRSCMADQRLYFTCQQSLVQISLQSTKKLILDKEANGEWLQALALALDYYENYVQVLEDRLRQQDWDARGRDMRWHPELMRSGRMTDADEWITMLLLRYLKLAVENAPINHNSRSVSIRQNGAATSATTGRVDLTISHYTMLAGICVEYCIGTRRLNVLYQQVYPAFLQSGYESVFFNVLEPYALKDALKYMSPEVMAAFVEHCKRNGSFESVERCLLHLDVTIMDFNSILPILKSNEMYSALLHVFTHGLDDYVTPLEILLEGVMDAFEEMGPELCNASRRLDGVFQNKFEQFGYKALLYLTYCFQGKSFPAGSRIEPVERMQPLRPQLLKFLLQPGYRPSSNARRSHSTTQSAAVVGRRTDPYPYLSILVLVDAKALLDLFSVVLDSKDVIYEESSFDFQTENGWDFDVMQPSPVALVEDEAMSPATCKSNVCPDRQLMVSILASLIRPTDASEDTCIAGLRQTRAAKNSFLDFIAKYLDRGVIRAPKSLTHAVLTRLSHAASKLLQDRSAAQGSIIALIQALPPDSYDLEKIIPVMEGNQMTGAALLLHKVGADAGFRAMTNRVTKRSIFGSEAWEASFAHFVRAVKCYINDSGRGAHPTTEIFEYVKTYHTHVRRHMEKVNVEYTIDMMLQRALLAIMPKLVVLDAVRSAQLVAELFLDDLEVIVDCLRKERDGEILFEFFRAVISGQLSTFDSALGPVLLANLSADQHHLYLALMAKFHPDMVYRHLLTHDIYRAEECLKLCQECDIPDATAYMLERSGEILSALQLLLQTLESRMMVLKRIIRGIALNQISNSVKLKSIEIFGQSRGRTETVNEAFSQRQLANQRIKQMLSATLDLCERNSGGSGSEQRKERGSQLWFNVLDRLINAKGLLRLPKEHPKHAELFSNVLSDLLQLTMQRMVSNVPLPDLLHKITIEHSKSRLGEFREMLMSMLKTYTSELDICLCAMDVVHFDKKRMSAEKQQLKLQGMEVRSVMGHSLGRGLSPISISLQDSRILIKVGSNGDAIQGSSTRISLPTISMEGAGFSADASARLRKHRWKRSNSGDQYALRGKLSCMTLTDHQLSSTVTDIFHLGQRHVGMLTDAEHVGSLGL